MNIYVHSQLSFLPFCAIFAYCTRTAGSDRLIILAYARTIDLTSRGTRSENSQRA